MIDKEALLQLIYQGFERTNVDYKRSMPWDKETKFELTKDILCFSNFGGGYIIIGVDESGKDENEKFAGVKVEHQKTWDVTDILKTVSEYSSSPIDLNLIPIPDESKNRMFLVINVPSHGTVPHICIKDRHDNKNKHILRKGAIYCRNHKKCCEELSNPTEVAELIRRCTLSDKERLLKEFSEILSGRVAESLKSRSKVNAFAEMRIFSKQAGEYIPDELEEFVFWEMLCHPINELKQYQVRRAEEALLDACVDYRGWPFVFMMQSENIKPRFSDSSIFAYSNEPFYDIKKFNFWLFDYTRSLFYSKNITEESALDKPKIFDPTIQRIIIAECLISQGRLFHSLEFPLNEIFQFALKFTHTSGIKVAHTTEWGHSVTHTDPFHDNTLTIVKNCTLDRLLNQPEYVSAEIVIELLGKMGFPKSPDIEVFVVPIKKHLAKGNKLPLHMTYGQ